MTTMVPGKLDHEERPATITSLVDAALKAAGCHRCAPDATRETEGAGYTLYPLFADAAGMRDGIVVVEHVAPGSEPNEAEACVHHYHNVLKADPRCASLHVRAVKVGFNPEKLQLWVW